MRKRLGLTPASPRALEQAERWTAETVALLGRIPTASSPAASASPRRRFTRSGGSEESLGLSHRAAPGRRRRTTSPCASTRPKRPPRPGAARRRACGGAGIFWVEGPE